MLVTLRGKRVNKEEKITGDENVTFQVLTCLNFLPWHRESK